jgi:hypothetical protein
MLYLPLIEKADSFKFAPEKRKTKPAAVPERSAIGKNGFSFRFRGNTNHEPIVADTKSGQF